ncbi:hypothetical protein QCM77_40035 [Bradyrhizobium sp. SSUT18]|nr:hypothetical protein [Bradyrhizobium sp. SSUT18]MDH2406035.1 hypothetical protein [Bradyrhizobium sp. SSUT18]
MKNSKIAIRRSGPQPNYRGVLPNKVDVRSFLLGTQFDAAKKAVALELGA